MLKDRPFSPILRYRFEVPFLLAKLGEVVVF